jgi:hypothetical protein
MARLILRKAACSVPAHNQSGHLNNPGQQPAHTRASDQPLSVNWLE